MASWRVPIRTPCLVLALLIGDGSSSKMIVACSRTRYELFLPLGQRGAHKFSLLGFNLNALLVPTVPVALRALVALTTCSGSRIP